MSDPSPSPHVARYLARLDAHLAALEAGARREFLRREVEKWLARYTDFSRRVERGQPVDPAVHAADYVVTIAEIDARLAALTQAVPAETASCAQEARP